MDVPEWHHRTNTSYYSLVVSNESHFSKRLPHLPAWPSAGQAHIFQPMAYHKHTSMASTVFLSKSFVPVWFLNWSYRTLATADDAGFMARTNDFDLLEYSSRTTGHEQQFPGLTYLGIDVFSLQKYFVNSVFEYSSRRLRGPGGVRDCLTHGRHPISSAEWKC